MSLSVEQLEAITTCRNCHGIYKDPRSLPCTHTFCLACLSARDNAEEIQCPSCSQRFKISGDGIRGLPKNFHVGDVIELQATYALEEQGGAKASSFELSIGSSYGVVTRRLQVLMTATAKNFARKIFICIDVNDLNYAKMLMENIQETDRAAVMRELSDDGCSPLFQAVRLGRKDFVEYFLDECNADIEQRGTWFYSSSGAVLCVTPLWLAAVEKNFDIVKYLLRRGANINAQCQQEPSATVLRVACVFDHEGSYGDVIRHLIENGADVNIKPLDGYTCLQSVASSPELCSYLLERGAKINDATYCGWAALHFAIEYNCLDAVKVLLHHGADATLRNEDGDNAVMLAAILNRHEIAEYLLKHVKTDNVTLANAYAMTAVQCVLRQEFDEAFKYWRLANLQLTRADNTVFKLMVYSRIVGREKWKNIRLPTGPYNRGDFAQTLVGICDDALGIGHHATFDALTDLIRIHYDNNDYADALTGCLDLVRRTRSKPYKHRPSKLVTCLSVICDIFVHLHCERVRVPFSAVSDVYSAILDEFTDTMKLTYARVDWSDLLKLMELSKFYLFLLLDFATKPSEKTKLLELTKSLVRLQPRAVDGQSLLHTAVRKTEVSYELFDFRVIKTLLEAGISVNLTDRNGDTALDYVIKDSSIPLDLSTSLRDLLLQYGATVGDRMTS